MDELEGIYSVCFPARSWWKISNPQIFRREMEDVEVPDSVLQSGNTNDFDDPPEDAPDEDADTPEEDEDDPPEDDSGREDRSRLFYEG